MNCEQQEWIDRFLLCELEGEELQRFELKYADDEVFREEVDLQAEIMVGINTYCAARSVVDAPKPVTELKVVNRFYSKMVWMKYGLRAAAMIALLVVAQIMFNTMEFPNNLYVENTKGEQHLVQKDLPKVSHPSSRVLALKDESAEYGIPVALKGVVKFLEPFNRWLGYNERALG